MSDSCVCVFLLCDMKFMFMESVCVKNQTRISGHMYCAVYAYCCFDLLTRLELMRNGDAVRMRVRLLMLQDAYRPAWPQL